MWFVSHLLRFIRCSAGRLIVPESLPSHYYRSVTVQPYSEKVPVEVSLSFIPIVPILIECIIGG